MNNAQRGRENEVQALQAIGSAGWLNATQVGKWVWGASNGHSARVSADRLLGRLSQRGAIKQRESGDGLNVYVLTRAGARLANEPLTAQIFKDGYDLSQLDVGRQRVAVSFLIEQQHAGRIVLGRAATRGAISSKILDRELGGSDAVIYDDVRNEYTVALVVRNIHPECVKKGQKLLKAIAAVGGRLELLGDERVIRCFRREMSQTA